MTLSDDLNVNASIRQYQMAVEEWGFACFPEAVCLDVEKRSCRFFEEATELFQAMGQPEEYAIRLVKYSYSRPVGIPDQEIGGVMVGLMMLANAIGRDVSECSITEFARIWTDIEKIRAKQAAQKENTPLPGYAEEPIEVAKPASLDELLLALAVMRGERETLVVRINELLTANTRYLNEARDYKAKYEDAKGINEKLIALYASRDIEIADLKSQIALERAAIQEIKEDVINANAT